MTPGTRIGASRVRTFATAAGRGTACTSKAERWVKLTQHQSRGLQGRRDDRSVGNMRRCASRRCRYLRDGETCGFEGRCDDRVWVERVIRLPVFALSSRGFGRSGDEGAAVTCNLNGC